MDFPCFRIDQSGKSSLISTLLHDLPGAVPVNPKDELLPVFNNRSTLANIFVNKIQCTLIKREYTLSSAFVFTRIFLFYAVAALRAKEMRCT